jgi:hypothetical protein
VDPDIFITDFERTENTDDLHAVLGRALIVATRFDSMCEAAAAAFEFKAGLAENVIHGEAEYQEYASKIVEKYRTLNQNIETLRSLGDISVVLHDARKARNRVAHDLAIGLTGCLDTKVNEDNLIEEVSDLIVDIAYGDIAISLTVSVFNGDPVPTKHFIASYKDRIVNWVTER